MPINLAITSMEGIVRCITKDGKERYLPIKMTKDAQLMRQMELTVQDLEVSKKEIEDPKKNIQMESTEIPFEKETAKIGRKPKETDELTNG